MSVSERLGKEFQGRELSPWEVAEQERKDYYRKFLYCDGVMVDDCDMKYPDIRESFGY